MPDGGGVCARLHNGDHLADGQILESTRTMGTGKAARSRRVIYQYTFSRCQHANRAINPMITRAEEITTGTAPLAKTRFVKLIGATKSSTRALDWACPPAGLKGYATNLPPATLRRAGRDRCVSRPLPGRTDLSDGQA